MRHQASRLYSSIFLRKLITDKAETPRVEVPTTA